MYDSTFHDWLSDGAGATKLFSVAFSGMFHFSVSCFLLYFLNLIQLSRAAENDVLPPPLTLGRIAFVYHTPLEHSLLSAAKEGNVEKVSEILASNQPIDANLLANALLLASDTNKHTVVRAILGEQVVRIDVIQRVLLDAARKNSGETVAEILRSGAYDPADIFPTFTAALIHNSVSVVKAFLQFPKFSYPDSNRTRAIELCKENKFIEMEKLLLTPRDQLLPSADSSTCTIF